MNVLDNTVWKRNKRRYENKNERKITKRGREGGGKFICGVITGVE